MTPYGKKAEDVLKDLNVTAESGLSAEEVLARRAQYGENRLREKKKKSLAARFFE